MATTATSENATIGTTTKAGIRGTGSDSPGKEEARESEDGKAFAEHVSRIYD